MKKIIFIFILIIMVIVVTVITTLWRNSTFTSSSQPTPTLLFPSPRRELTPLVTVREQPSSPTIVKLDPPDGAAEVALNQPITVTFNRNINQNEIIVEILPATPFTTQINGNALTINPTQNYETGTPYYYVFKYPYLYEDSQAYTFITTGPTPEVLPETFPTGGYEIREEFHKENYPDIYVANKTPYETDTFSVVRDVNLSTGKFYFKVTMKNPDENKVKSDVLNWLRSIGLQDSQIQSLEIQYHSI